MKHLVKTQSRTCEDFCVLTVTAGTNCPQGGDAGHGGRTIFRLQDEGGTAATISIDGQEHQPFDRFELILSGDAEYKLFVEALEFALNVLADKGHQHQYVD